MFEHTFSKRVRYAETDKMGYLYYGHYAKYYEIGRVELLRSVGLTYKEMEDQYGIMLPVVKLESRYLKPAFYDDEIVIKTILSEMPRKLLKFQHELYNPDNELINTAEVKLFFIDMNTNEMVSAPEILTDKLKSYFT